MTHSSSIQGRRIGYVRMNTLCADLEDQLEGLQLDRIFMDMIIRKKQFLSGFAEMLGYVRAGDVLFIQTMDRLARNPRDFFDTVYGLTRRGIRIECVTEKLIFPAGEESPIRNLILLAMGAFMEATQAWSSERQREARAGDGPAYRIIGSEEGFGN